MSPLMRRQSGFTLVEVMVALVVMSLMSLLAWRGLDGLLKSRDITQSHLQHSARLQTVMAQWEQDLLALQDSGGSPALSFDGATLRITRQRPAGMQVVAWSLRDGGLYRWEDRPVQTVAALQESLQRSQQSLAQDKTQLLTIEGVNGWQVFFYRGNGWSNAQSSDDLAGPAPAASAAASAATSAASAVASATAGPPRSVLPSGVRMILQFAPGSEFSGSLTRQIALGPQS